MLKILLVIGLSLLVSCGYLPFPEEHIKLELDVTSKSDEVKPE